MKHGYRVVMGVAFVLVLLLQGQVRGEALFVDAADDYLVLEPVLGAVTGVTATLTPGWQMVSLPVMPADASLGAVFPDAISAYAFAGTGYEKVAGLSACEGYWVNVMMGGEYWLMGQEVEECAGTLPAGWSLMGVPKGGTAVGAIVQDPVANVLSVWGFAGGYYPVEDELVEGEGYWVNLAVEGDLTLEGGAAAGKRVADVRRQVPQTGSKLVVESSGHALTLELGATAELMVALPPAPPAGAFDARAEVGGVATQNVPGGSQPMDYRVRLQGSDLVLRWDVDAQDAERWQLVVEGTTYALSGVGSLNLATAPADMWLRYTPALPQQSALLANYPNPFNPSTTLRYELAVAADVRLTIYNVLGQPVRELVQMRQPGGVYAVVWDGRNDRGQQVANGMYFYEIKAGEFHAIRKMMLAK